mgnify:CR=1 FL=1
MACNGVSEYGCNTALQDAFPRLPVQVLVGAEVELCIFPGDSANPILIDGATVRWCQPNEFGLSFTKIRVPVQRQLTDVWRKLAKPA